MGIFNNPARNPKLDERIIQEHLKEHNIAIREARMIAKNHSRNENLRDKINTAYHNIESFLPHVLASTPSGYDVNLKNFGNLKEAHSHTVKAMNDALKVVLQEENRYNLILRKIAALHTNLGSEVRQLVQLHKQIENDIKHHEIPVIKEILSEMQQLFLVLERSIKEYQATHKLNQAFSGRLKEYYSLAGEIFRHANNMINKIEKEEQVTLHVDKDLERESHRG